MPFVLGDAFSLFLGPDEPLQGAVFDVARRFDEGTVDYWHDWVRDLSIPFEWQDEVIRAAITLKLNAFDDTGAVIAALTTSIPEAAGTARTWDYRYCWLRDAYFVVNALNRLNATRTMERYLGYIINVAARADGRLQPVYRVSGQGEMAEREIPSLPGYRGPLARCAWATTPGARSRTTFTVRRSSGPRGRSRVAASAGRRAVRVPASFAERRRMAAADTIRLIKAAVSGQRLDRAAALQFADESLELLMQAAEELTVSGFGTTVTYSRKVFIPLTQLCRDVCHYCTFAKAPRRGPQPYLSPEEVLATARAGQARGCKEALFTLGDKPEMRYRVARRALDERGLATTLEYLEQMASLVLRETGLLPHLNPGVMDRDELARLRKVSVSMGIMLESSSDRLAARGGPHFGSPDKWPARRLETIRGAGELAIPLTSGLLIGIGETRQERVDSLLALRDLHDEFGHLQEVIIQNFRAKPATKMHAAPEPGLAAQLWTLAVARLLFGPSMSIQAPPNLRAGDLGSLIHAGVNDWGGVSPVTPDHVNPEAPCPQLAELAAETVAAGRHLSERLAVGPAYARAPSSWVDAALQPAVRRLSDSRGLAREDGWYAGTATALPSAASGWVHPRPRIVRASRATAATLAAARAGEELSESAVAALFAAA